MNFTKHNNDTTAPPAQDVSLDKNHKVFLLYDDDSKGTFGTETRFRARFEETLVEMSKRKWRHISQETRILLQRRHSRVYTQPKSSFVLDLLKSRELLVSCTPLP